MEKFTARREESESGVEKGGSRAPDFEFCFSPHYPNGIFQVKPKRRQGDASIPATESINSRRGILCGMIAM